MADIKTEINLSDVRAWVDRVWAEPSPEAMDVLLRGMDRAVRQLSKARDGVISSWKLSDVLERDELEKLLDDWDARANQLWFRLGAYRAEIDAMLAGNITGRFTAYVVEPILRGHGYASPDREEWSKVHFPDVLEPFRLWNELGAFATGTDILDFYRREAQNLVSGFGEEIRDQAGRLAADAASRLREEAEDLISRAEDVATQKRQELSGTITAAIVGGALILGIGAFFLFRGRRKRAAA